MLQRKGDGRHGIVAPMTIAAFSLILFLMLLLAQTTLNFYIALR